PCTAPRIPERFMPSLIACWKASSRSGPVVPLVPARDRTWQAPHFATNICLPAMRSTLPPPGCVEQALSASAVTTAAARARAIRRRELARTGPIGRGTLSTRTDRRKQVEAPLTSGDDALGHALPRIARPGRGDERLARARAQVVGSLQPRGDPLGDG